MFCFYCILSLISEDCNVQLTTLKQYFNFHNHYLVKENIFPLTDGFCWVRWLSYVMIATRELFKNAVKALLFVPWLSSMLNIWLSHCQVR